MKTLTVNMEQELMKLLDYFTYQNIHHEETDEEDALSVLSYKHDYDACLYYSNESRGFPRSVRNKKCDIPLICFTGFSSASQIDTEFRMDQMKMGCDQIITLPCSKHEAELLVLNTIRRSRGMTSHNQVFGDITINVFAKSMCHKGVVIHMTNKHWALLAELCDKPDRVLEKEYIHERMYYESDSEPDPKIIDVYKHKINSKLRDLLGYEFILTDWGNGIRIAKNESDTIPV